ncbi:MAG: hypothetical protein AAF497_05500 [Planctomycetota bacterium]
MDLSEIGDALSALLTPVIGLLAAWIAYQQYQTNRKTEEREARTARIAVYKQVKRLLNFIDTHCDVDQDLYEDFLSASAEADFLFDQELSEWLGEVQGEVDQFNAWQDALIDLKREHGLLIEPDEKLQEKAPKDYEYLKKEMQSNIDKLQDFHIALYDKFRPFLSRR